jgi:hypothetical protein
MSYQIIFLLAGSFSRYWEQLRHLQGQGPQLQPFQANRRIPAVPTHPVPVSLTIQIYRAPSREEQVARLRVDDRQLARRLGLHPQQKLQGVLPVGNCIGNQSPALSQLASQHLFCLGGLLD